MSAFIYEAVGPPRWCSLTPEQWREQWQSVIRRAASSKGEFNLEWIQDTSWGRLRWEALSYYDALTLAEGNAGRVCVPQVTVFDPRGTFDDSISQQQRSFSWWSWRRDGRSLGSRTDRGAHHCEGTKLVLASLIGPVEELEQIAPWLGSASLTREVTLLARRLLWSAAGIADLVEDVPQAETAFHTAQSWLHQLVEATRSARERAVIQSDERCLRDVGPSAVHRESVDHVLQQLRGLSAPSGAADGTNDGAGARSGEGSDLGVSDDTGTVGGLHEYGQVNAPRQGLRDADSFYGPRHSSVEEPG